jgi:hypothetical protein
MRRDLIMKLALLLKEDGDKAKVKVVEECIVESIEEVIEEELFFSLPTKEIIKIIKKSDISDAETYSNIISKMSETKGGWASLILNFVEAKEATLEECIKIVSSLKCSPVCIRLGELYREELNKPEIDYEYEIIQLKKEIEKLNKQKPAVFKPIPKEPIFFESDIHKAALAGNLESVQYLIEQRHVSVEKKDYEGWTPLHYASRNGKIDVVKYLVEQCHAKVRMKTNSGRTPLQIASMNFQDNVVEYLRNKCSA